MGVKSVNVSVPEWLYDKVLKSKKNKSAYIVEIIIKDNMKFNSKGLAYSLGGCYV